MNRLRVNTKENVFWSKRGLIESQLVRLASTFKSSAASELTPEMRESCQWLIYLVAKQMRRFVATLANCGLQADDSSFVGRSLVSFAEHAGLTEHLLRHAVYYELDVVLPLGKAAAAEAFLRRETLAGFIVRHYASQRGEQYLQVVLSQTFEQFVDLNTSEPFLETSDAEELLRGDDVQVLQACSPQLVHWTELFLTKLYRSESSDLIPFELRVVIALIHEACLVKNGGDSVSNRSAQDGKLDRTLVADPYLLIGAFLFAQYITPAIESPQSYGLAHAQMPQQQALNLQLISRVMKVVAGASALNVRFDDRRDVSGNVGALVQSQLDSMRQYVGSLVFADALTSDGLASSEAAASTALVTQSTRNTGDDITAILAVVRSIDLTAHNTKMLAALTRTLSLHMGRLLCSSWIASEKQRVEGEEKLRSAAARRVTISDPTNGESDGESTPHRGSRDQAELLELKLKVHELRDACDTAKEEEARVKVYAARLSEEIASLRAQLAETKQQLEDATENTSDAGSVRGAARAPSTAQRHQDATLNPLRKLSRSSASEPDAPFGCPLDTYALPAADLPSSVPQKAVEKQPYTPVSRASLPQKSILVKR